MIPFAKLTGVADPLAAALHYAQEDWAAGLLAFGAVVAMTAVLLVFQLGQPRILMAMSRDGLLGPWFSKIHPKFRTPHVTTILTGVFVGFFAAIANIDEIVQLTNIGTLFAFVLVCIGIIILRAKEPVSPIKFRVPFVPLVPILGVLSCALLMAGLPPSRGFDSSFGSRLVCPYILCMEGNTANWCVWTILKCKFKIFNYCVGAS